MTSTPNTPPSPDWLWDERLKMWRHRNGAVMSPENVEGYWAVEKEHQRMQLVSETWFPIASAPENEWVQVRWERAAGVVARMRLSWGQMSWETRSGFVIKPTSWRLLPEQDALKGEHHEL